MEEILKRLRKQGWRVAVHNDYRLSGRDMTFWLMTHDNGTYLKGEARMDLGALRMIEMAANQQLKQET